MGRLRYVFISSSSLLPHFSLSLLSTSAHANLTTQYLSPERAKGQKHDTRKSDVWALGVTFFEVLVGRTPFEHQEGEQLATEAELKGYWERTVRRTPPYPPFPPMLKAP